MLSGQFVCGRGKAVFSVLFLLSATYSFSMESEETIPTLPLPKVLPYATGMDTPPAISKEATSSMKEEEDLHPQMENGALFGSTIKEMEDVYQDAPKRAKRFVRHILDPRLLRQPHNRILILSGPPGTGKSTLANAIAYKTGSTVDPVDIGEIQGDSRNQTGKNLYHRLHDTLKWVVKDQKNTIVYIDELNKIMENAEDKHHDTGFTATILWRFLDRLRGVPLYFIATMNQTHKLPKQMKSRIGSCTVEIGLPEDPKKRIEILKKQLISDYVSLGGDCNDDYLFRLFKATEGFSGRDYKGLADEAVGQYIDETDDASEKVILQRKHLNAAVEVIMEARRISKYYRLDETDEEQRERHFMQGQMAALKIQEKQKGQTSVGVPGLLSRTTNGGMNRSDIKNVMEECFTQEQLEILKGLHDRDTVLMPNWREWLMPTVLGFNKKV